MSAVTTIRHTIGENPIPETRELARALWHAEATSELQHGARNGQPQRLHTLILEALWLTSLYSQNGDHS